jgi:protein-S-isoprenylcysteine O-methyltransferase Ste14
MASKRTSVIISILFIVFGGPGCVLGYFPYWITGFRVPASEPVWQRVVAGLLILAGLVPLLASIRRFITVGRGTLMPAIPTERLVVSGLYRYVRNPMYLGVLTSLCGESLLIRTGTLVDYTLVIWLMFHLFVIAYEEPALGRQHPGDYPRYKRNVRRWLPRLTPWDDSATKSVW